MIPSLYTALLKYFSVREQYQHQLRYAGILDKFNFQISLVCIWRSATRPTHRQGLTICHKMEL